MKKQITAAMMILTMIATPVMANSMDNPAFENQVVPHAGRYAYAVGGAFSEGDEGD